MRRLRGAEPLREGGNLWPDPAPHTGLLTRQRRAGVGGTWGLSVEKSTVQRVVQMAVQTGVCTQRAVGEGLVNRLLAGCPPDMCGGRRMEPGGMRGKRAENYHYMADAMRRLEWDLHHTIEATGRIPLEWHQIAQEPVRQGAERVAIRLDRDVLRFFRSMGPGYGPRINLVLRTYMHARLAGVIRGAETAPEFRFAVAPERPLWGETAAGLGAGPGPDEVERGAEAAARAAERVKAARVGG